MSKPKTFLRDADIKKVDLVDLPANPEAKIMIFKRNDSSIGEGNDSLDSIVNTINDIQKAGKAMSNNRLSKLKEILGMLQKMIIEVEPTVEPTGDMDDDEAEKGGKKCMDKVKKSELSKEVQDYIAGLETENEELKKSQKSTTEDTDEKQQGSDIMKSLPEEIKKRLEKAEADAKAAQDEIKKMQDKQVSDAFIAKAKSYEYLGIKADEFGPVLKALSEVDLTYVEKLDAVLKAANAASKNSGAFEEKGSSVSGGGNTSSGTWSKIEAAAMGMVEKSNHGMSKEQAIAKYFETEEGSKLYSEYLNERRG